MVKSIKSILGITANNWLINNEEFMSKYVVICLVALSQGVLALSEVPISFLYKDNF